MVKESLVASLALDKSEQETIDNILNEAVGKAVKILFADHDLQKPGVDADANPTVYDPGQSKMDIPGASWDLQRDSRLPSITSSEEDHPFKTFEDWSELTGWLSNQ
jgi:hypothetical protein